MRWLIVVLALSLSCSPSQVPVTCAPGEPPGPQPLGFPGEAVVVEAPFLRVCNIGGRPTAAEASVLDPSNQPIAAEVIGFGDRQAHVKFTPLIAGRHVVAVRFEPNLGTTQLQVEVAVDRRGPGFELELDAQWLGCTHLDVLPSGRPVCLGATGARAGSVVWTSDGGEVARFVEGDGGLALTGSVRVPAIRLLASENDVSAIDSSVAMRRISWTGAMLVVVQAAQQFPLGNSDEWLGWRAGDAGHVMPIAPQNRLWGVNVEGAFFTPGARSQMPLLHTGLAMGPPDEHPFFPGLTAVERPQAEWDTAPLLETVDGEHVVVGWDAGFVFTRFGKVISATSEWVSVRQGDKVFVYRR